MSFVHLHTHSEYSITDGLPRIADLIDNAAKKDFTAIALTDMHNLFAGIKFYTQAIQNGVKPIIGCEVRLDIGLSDLRSVCSIVLLCMNNTGYKNLMSLLSQSYQQAERTGAVVTYEQLQTYGDGLLVLSGGCRGDLGQYWLLNRQERAEKALAFWKQNFPDRYYIEIFRTGRDNEEQYANTAIECALEHQLPIIATNDIRFLERDQFDVHEARVCIANSEILGDENRSHHYSQQQYLKTEADMKALFSDIPEALDNAAEIAKRCNVSIETDKVLLPVFPLPEGITADQYLREQSEAGLEKPGLLSEDIALEDYHQRLEYELDVIAKMGYAGYFLIVADFVEWAKKQRIPVGPGRGSGASSLVAYALGITEIDPLSHQLLFERFLNPERVSMPDFDIDFCMEQRDRVIEYVGDTYGRDKVSQIITFGSMAAKAVVRDVGRVQGRAYNFVDQIAKLIPNDLNITLEKALEQSSELKERYKNEREVAAIIDTGMELEGLSRNPGKHAGGIVLAPQPLTNYTALYSEAGEAESILTQYDMKDIEKIGLVKFDFLGLKTLTVIDKTVRYINQTGNNPGNNHFHISDITSDDPATYNLLQKAQTKSIFQLESEGVRVLLSRLKPDKFEDIVALLALYRPGPMKSGMMDDYIRCKQGGEIAYPHPKTIPILKSTYGVILYQEQVMQIAQDLSGYSLGDADLLRRAMGKKMTSEMAKLRESFISGAEHNGVERRVAASIYDKIKEFAGYGFNRSHSVAYALITYQTAWLKAHYPAEFMAAVLSTEMRFTDKTVESVYECRAMGITILPPDINTSQWEYTVINKQTILYGFGAIRHLGKGATKDIINERTDNGPFSSFQDFCLRMIPKRLKRNTLQALLTAGTMDSLGESRGELLANIDELFTFASRCSEDSMSGQTDLFGDGQSSPVELPVVEPDSILSRDELREKEKYSLGFYLTDHPLAELKETIAKMLKHATGTDETTDGKKDDSRWFAGVIINKKRSGRNGMFFTLDDGESLIRFAAFGQEYNAYHEMLGKEMVLFIRAKIRYEMNKESHSWQLKEALSLEKARAVFAKGICMQVKLSESVEHFIHILQESIAPFVSDDGCRIKITVTNEDACADLVLGEKWKVKVCNQVLFNLRHLEGVHQLSVAY